MQLTLDTYFDGDDYNHKRDCARLSGQILDIYNHMQKHGWQTLDQIARATDHPHASVSAQLRNLRKDRFGGHTIERRHIENGLYQYRLVEKSRV